MFGLDAGLFQDLLNVKISITVAVWNDLNDFVKCERLSSRDRSSSFEERRLCGFENRFFGQSVFIAFDIKHELALLTVSRGLSFSFFGLKLIG